MESRLKEEEEGEEGQLRDNVQQLERSLLSHSRKLVPWLNWDEWLFVEHSLFSDSPDTVASALRRILAWQSRGCLPVAIEVTASIIEIQQKDPHFRKDQSHGATFDYREDQTNNGSLSEEILAMLYCMAIIRLVNGVIEKARKKTEVSIAVAADAIGIPRMLIDIRHEGSHRELPALKMVRSASVKALDWLKSYYWEPQKKAIPFQGAGTTSVREEIKFKLSELALALKFKQSPLCSSPKGKRSRHCELLWGRNKFFSLVGRNHQLSKSGVSKKQITKNLKILVQLYSSFPSEVVSILLEFLSKAINSSDLVELPEDFQVGPITCTALDNWKLVITKLSNKEPELLLTLLKAVLDMIETQEAMKYETGRQHQTWSDYRQDISQIQHLSSMFAWLVESLKGLKPPRQKFSAAEIEVYPTETNVSKTVLLELLHKCLLVSASGNKQLMDSALHLAQLMGQSILIEKLKKLPSLGSSNLYVTEEEIPSMTNLLTQQEESISQAAKKLELVKLNRMKSKVAETRSGDAKNIINKWVVSRSWNPCPIGMLPHTLGSSGCLPVLERRDVHSKVPESSEREGNRGLNRCSSKREASCDIQQIDKSNVKKRKETMEACASDAIPSMEGVKGHLMIGGIWMGVGEDELLAMESDVRILV